MNTSNSYQINFDIEKTQIIKGIAILSMIIHHSIIIPTGNNWLDLFGASMKICVHYFTFLVGFGYAFSKQKTVEFGIRRSFKLILQFWLILFTIFIPLHIIEGGKLSIYQVLTDSFGLESEYHWFSWYIYFYIYAMLIMPFISKVIDKYGLKAFLYLLIGSYFLELIIHTIPNWSSNIFTQAFFDCLLNTPLLLIGYFSATQNIFSKVKLKIQHTTFLLLLLC